jgi:hypothetical protein
MKANCQIGRRRPRGIDHRSHPVHRQTGATDTAAINTALGGVGAGGSVLLDPGDWYTSAPLDIPGGTELAGIKAGSTVQRRCLPPVR